MPPQLLPPADLLPLLVLLPVVVPPLVLLLLLPLMAARQQAPLLLAVVARPDPPPYQLFHSSETREALQFQKHVQSSGRIRDLEIASSTMFIRASLANLRCSTQVEVCIAMYSSIGLHRLRKPSQKRV